MSEENKDNNKTGKLGKQETETRTSMGGLKPGFNPQKEAIYKKEQEKLIQKSPREADYTKMNSFLAKQLGIEAKLADFQTQYEPEALFKQLSFMADNTERKGGTQSNTLPENQPIAPISPQPNKYELPGEQLKKPNLSKDGFSVSFKIDPKDLLQPKKKQ